MTYRADPTTRGQWTNALAPEFGVTGNGIASDVAAIAKVQATAAGTICFPAATYYIDADVTFSSANGVVVMPGAMFKFASGVKLTFNGPFFAMLFRCFTGAGTVAFSRNLKVVHPEWWGMQDNAVGLTDALCASNTSTTITSASTTFTSGDVGKCCVLLNATAGSYGAVGSIVAASGNSITVSTPPGIAVTSGQTGVLFYGTDNNAPINTAIAAAAPIAATVDIASSMNSIGYLYTGTLTLNPAVTLKGPWEAPPRYPGGGNIGSVTIATGATLAPIGGIGTTSFSTPAVMMQSASTIKGVVFRYPAQWSGAAPIPYPPTIVMAQNHEQGAILDVELVNSYYGVICDLHQRPYIDKLYGEPLYVGLYIDRCYDIPRVNNIHFWQGYFQAYNSVGVLETWVRTNAIGVVAYRVDGLQGSNWMLYGYSAGVYLGDSPQSGVSPAGGTGVVHGLWIDGGCHGVVAADTQYVGWHFTGTTIFTLYGAGSRCFLASGGGNSAKVRFSGYNFNVSKGTGDPAYAVEIQPGAHGRYTFSDGDFQSWNTGAVLMASTDAKLKMLLPNFLDTGTCLDVSTLTSFTGVISIRAWEAPNTFQLALGSYIPKMDIGDAIGMKNSGGGTVAVGQSSVVISHGLIAAPARVGITLTSAPQGIPYVSAKTATTFTVTLPAAATGTAVTFDWDARVWDGC